MKRIDTKNSACYCFHDIIKIEDFDFEIISIDKTSYKNVLVYETS